MEKQLSIQVNTNGSIEILPSSSISNPRSWISALLLLIGFCFGVGFGLATLLGLRIRSCPRAIIGLQIAAVLDCIHGQALGAVFQAVQPDQHMCRYSASTSTAFLVIETAEMSLVTFPLQSFQIGYIPWVIGIFIGLSIFVDYQNIPVTFYPSRHGCSVVNGQHGWFPMIVTFAIATSWLGAASGIIYSAIFKETNTDIIVSRILAVFYLVLVLPSALIIIISMSMKPYLNNFNEVIFSWTRYQFNIIIPIVILIFYKRVRKKSENLLFWCRKNSVGQITDESLHNYATQIQLRNRILNPKYQTKKCKPITPVLFATSNGLHLRTITSFYDTDTPEIKEHSSLHCTPCDLTDNETRYATSHSNLGAQQKYVRFNSPVDSDVFLLNESGVWSNTEAVECVQINTRNHKDTSDDDKFGFTYTKV